MTRKRTALLLTTAVTITALLATYALLRGSRAEGDPYAIPAASTDQMVAVAAANVFFAHRSVGGNMLDSVPALYRAHEQPVPEFADLTDATAGENLRHYRFAENGDPLAKIAEFDGLIRGGLGDELDVAVLKLCYSDIRADTDVEEVFTAYRDTFADLQRDYPAVTFVPATVPLNITRGPLSTVKAWLGRPDRFGPEHNIAREELNALLRAEYADSGLLFDVASIESTTPEGDRIARTHDGRVYYALDRAYADGTGHLNALGGRTMAGAFFAVVASALAS